MARAPSDADRTIRRQMTPDAVTMDVDPRVRSRDQLAIDIALYAITHRVEEIPVEFFSGPEEIAIAESLTGEETLRAAACVLESLAEQPTTSQAVRTMAWSVADVLHLKAWAYTQSRVPQQYVRRAPQRRPGTRARRVVASRDGPKEPHELEVIPLGLQGRAFACSGTALREHGMSRARVVLDERGEVVEYELRPRSRRPYSVDEELELRALVGLAWERRDTAAVRAATVAIEDWHDRRHIRAYERRQRSTAAVLQVLRDTNPDRRNRP